MISLKYIQTPFTPTKHVLFQRPRLAKKSSSSFLCKSNESNLPAPPPEGDTKQQELLAKIAMLQAQKVRLTDYLDERSSYLTQFAEEANAEFDQIGESALKELDETSNRVWLTSFYTVHIIKEVVQSLKILNSEITLSFVFD